jgi:hypothetical protein
MHNNATAADILQNAGSVYASCASYQDRGEHTVVYVQGRLPPGRRTRKLLFRTAFIRPDRFFFEYREVGIGPESEWRRGVIWADASGVWTWTTLSPESRRSESILSAGGSLAGVSGGTSAFLTRLLVSGSLCSVTLPPRRPRCCSERKN